MGDKAKTVSSAAEAIGGNEDLVVEILKRVPAKTLTRLRSVCKTWSFLISSDRFSLLHWQHQHQSIHHSNFSGLIINCRNKPELFHFTPFNRNNNESLEMFPPHTNHDVSIHDYCNGLILISSLGRGGGGHSRVYHVSNPITKKMSTLPAPFPLGTYSAFGHYVYLLFDPSKSLHYRVVLLHIRHTRLLSVARYCHIHIYSSETNTWWATSSAPPYPHLFEAPTSVHFGTGVSCNGNIHWLSFYTCLTSLYFDVDSKTFRPLPSPPFEISHASMFFGASGAHLHAVEYNFSIVSVGYNFVVCEMESDYSNWSPKYSFGIDLLFLDMEIVVRYDTLSLLNVIRGKDEGDVFLVLLVDTHIIYYNIKDHTYNKLQLLFLPNDDLSQFKFSRACAHPFTETLFLV